MMTSDNTPHRIFKISELTRAIASQLVLIGHKNLVNLACTSRYFEEPVLSTLWKTQASLYTLLEVLPRETWVSEDAGHNRRVVRALDLVAEIEFLMFRVVLVQDRGGSIARGLEQNLALCVLDAQGLRGR